MVRTSLMFSSSTATVLSTAMRARTTSAISFFCELDLLVARDADERDLALAADDLELARLLDALGLDGDLALAVLLGDGDAAHLRLVGDERLLLVLVVDEERLLLLVGGDARGLVLLAGLSDRRSPWPSWPRPRRGAARSRKIASSAFEVLAADLHALVLAELVRLHVVLDGDLGDLPDAVGVQDVVVVERLERGLLEVVDGGVVEDEAVQVLADDLDDLVLEVVALRVELRRS